MLWGHAWRNALVLAHYALNFVLAGVVAGEVYVLLSDDVQIPRLVRTRIEDELVARGIAATFDRAHFDPTGRIVLRGLRIRPSQFNEPILTAELAFIQLDRIKMLAGVPDPTHIKVEGVRVLCPPAISPSGVTETLLDIAGADLTHRGNEWQVNGLIARANELRITAEGDFELPPRSPNAPPPDLEGLWRQFTAVAPQIARVREYLARFSAPSLQIEFSGAMPSTFAADAVFSAARWRDPRMADVRDLDLALTTEMHAGILGPIHVVATARELSRSDGGTMAAVHASATWNGLPQAGDYFPAQLDVSAASISYRGEQVLAPVASVRNAGWPHVDAQLQLQVGEEVIAITARGDVTARTAEADIHGRFGRDWLARASAFLGRDVTYYATIETPPEFDAHVTVPENPRDGAIDFRVLSGPVTARGVPLDRARALGRLTADQLRVDYLEISKDDQHAIGVYEDRLTTRDNRLRLQGSMRPLAIAPWFGPWWKTFWEDYTFSGAAPECAVDVRGNWLAGHRNVVTGWGRAEQGTIRGLGYDSLELRFFIRPNFFDLYDATIARSDGRLAGELQLFYRPNSRVPAWQQFDFTSTSDLTELARLFGERGEELFAPYRYHIPPAVSARGRIEHNDETFDSRIQLSIATEHEFRYHDFPFESLSTEVDIHNSDVRLSRINAGYAGGFLDGTAGVHDDRLTFDANLSGAQFDTAVEVFTDFLNRRSPPPPEELAEEPSGFAGKKIGGLLDIQLAAEGPLTDFKAYDGSGSVRITQADLGSIKLFGLLVDVLGSVGIKAGILNFHSATSGLLVRRDHLLFPDARITGNTAALETTGTYSLSDRSVEFRARFFPLRESNGTLTQIVGVILDPFSNLLGVRLTGTLRKPHWIPTLAPRTSLSDKETVVQPGQPTQAPPPESQTPVSPETPKAESGEPATAVERDQ